METLACSSWTPGIVIYQDNRASKLTYRKPLCFLASSRWAPEGCLARHARSPARRLVLKPQRKARTLCKAEGEEKGRTAVTESEEKPAEGSVPESGPKGPDSKAVEEAPLAAKSDAKLKEVNVRLDAFNVLELLGPEKVDPNDVKLLKDRLFGYTTFWVTKQEPYGLSGESILLKGNLRGDREAVFKKLQAGLQALLPNKYELFMVQEPPPDDATEPAEGRVALILTRKEVSLPGPTTAWQYAVALILAVLTVGSALQLGFAAQLSRLPPEVVEWFTSPDPEALEPPDLNVLLPFVESALPLAYGVLGVQAFHEVGHRLAASSRQVQLSIPFLIPFPSLGTFGAITQFRSTVPGRRTLWDVAVAGPVAGAGLSLAMLASGLGLTAQQAPDCVTVPAQLFNGSLLLGATAKAVLGEALHQSNILVHPLLVVGWCGMTASALNLLPVGRLDGGRAMQATYGRLTLSISSFVTYVLLGLGVLGGNLALPFGIYVLICQRTAEKPCLDDVSGVGTLRQGALTAILAAVFFTLLPIWPELADTLGIGVNNLV